MNSNGYYSILPAFPLEDLPNVDATTLYPHLQQLCNHQLTTTAITTSMPAVAFPFYGMPLDIDMADVHQNTTLLNSNLPIMLETSANSDIADFQSTSALLIHGMPAAVPVPSTSLPLYDYNTNKPTIDTNSPEYLSYLSSLAQQQQQYKQRQVQIHQQLQQQLQRQLTESKSITPNPQQQHQQHQQQQPYHTNTTALTHATNRDPVQTTTTFLRPVNATNFEQTMYPTTTVEPTNDAATASLPLAADASIQRRRRGRPPLDRMPSFSSTPPLSPQVPTLTATPASTPNSTLSRSSSNSSTSSRSSRQSSPQSFFIMPPYQHSDHKVDRRSFNSRKQLKQAKARAAAEEEKEEAREEEGSERGREFE
ncbi:MAG: hypothetical protein J3R72DRAFT_432201 [Linnemannia gamsii]|nr:MAG: hypothetical protein J3R72DRAFT_432201 [Linnemannia gamsii]